ncbi:ABC transporter substrate-binding protein [Jonesia quinghaiensis]|uniref:ABC transporter substrate-binding protein n=1 Tax=Jonesia quinghaiensis TaxID=262806 RepID=UPI00040615DB|nr:extracellular solute-binding protein [Jonesia quinghaiensis]
MAIHKKLLATGAIAGTLALTLAACGGGGSDDPTAAPTNDSGELSGELTVWAWDQTIADVAEAFTAEHPDVTVDVVNVGTGNDQYIALQNAVAAETGGPDLAQIEYFAVPQFSIGGALADIGPMGASELDGTFTTGPWSALSQGDSVWGLPLDSGPMALFYNTEVFEKYDVDVPTTWDEFLEAARTLKENDVYLINDTGDAGFTTSMMWQAGGRPYEVNDTTVSVDFTDEGSKQFAEMWQTMIDEDLLAPIGSWSDEWYQGLGDGTIASLVIGAWMPGNLESGVPDGAGKWAVADMPQWNEGEFVTAENGGSSMAVMEGSDQKALAYEFVEFASAGEGIDIRVEGGAFPATVETLNEPGFLDREFEYFGGQKVNEVLSKAAGGVGEGWQYLPFQVYANSIFNDYGADAYNGNTPLADAFVQWGDASATYGEQQGFTIQ